MRSSLAIATVIGSTPESRAYQEIYAEGKEEGQIACFLMQLNTKLGQLSQQQQTRIQALTPDRLQNLGLALLNFMSMKDLNQWLEWAD